MPAFVSLYVPGRQVTVWLDLTAGWLQRGAAAVTPPHSNDESLQLRQEVCPSVEDQPRGHGSGWDIPLCGQ